MGSKYANAEKVLPPELLEQVRRYHAGLLWVPPSDVRDARDAFIVQRRAAGVAIRDIAEEVGLSPRRVRQILNQHRHRQSPRP